MWKRMLSIVLPVLFAFVAARPGCAEQSVAETVSIGIVVDGPGERSGEILRIFREEIRDLAGPDIAVSLPDNQVFVGDWTGAGARAALDRALGESSTGAVLVLGYLSGQAAGQRAPAKPVIAPFVIDPEGQRFPAGERGSGQPNFNYLAVPGRVGADLGTFHRLVPFKKIAVIADRNLLEFAPGLEARLIAAAAEVGAAASVIPADTDPAAALGSIPDGTDAAYLLPLERFGADGIEMLARGLADRKIPSFSFEGVSGVRRGVLLGQAPEDELRHRARRAALNLRNILLGSPADVQPVGYTESPRLRVYLPAAQRVGYRPDWATLTEAEIIGDPGAPAIRSLTLADAVREALATNVDLAAKERMVAAGTANVREARSKLLPQAEIGATGAVIDEDRAELGFGAYPERSVAGTASLTQVLWSEPARANLAIQKSLQTGRVRELDQVRLDVALEAAASYLNVLRARTLERVRKHDLEATRSHLDLARVRHAVGTAGPSESYRWEVQVALARKAALDAGAKRSLAEMALNRVLHRPLEESFDTAETRADDPALLDAGNRLTPWLNDPWSLEAFRGFLVKEGLDASPEIGRLDAAIEAQRRWVRSTERAFLSPTVALQGQVSEYWAKDGAGTTSIVSRLPPQLGALGNLFPRVDDTTWNVGVRVSFPLSRGGAKFAERDKARQDMTRLELERAAAAARIEQRIRSSLRLTGASFAGVGLSLEAAEAARKNLELVRDAYSRGVASAIDLIDAQNAALLTGESAANAEYDFLLDLVNTERAAGRFGLLMSGEERDAFFHRLEGSAAGVSSTVGDPK